MKGSETLFEFLIENKDRAPYMIKTLKQLGIEYSRELDELVEEAIGIR